MCDNYVNTHTHAYLCSLNGQHCDASSSTRETEFHTAEEHDTEDVGMGEPPLHHRPDRIWAVLVGIDNYEHSPLHGCVADALAMKAYLTDNLLVPKERIQTLLGPYNTVTDASSLPSRAGILSLLLSLATNPNIEHGDPIIIFFAGHGSRYLLSEHDDNECPPKFVETFCPMDRDSLDSGGVPIPDITDRELNTILSYISRTKGHRITFVVDCCHAGGVTRSWSSAARTAPPEEGVLPESILLAAESILKDLPGYRSIVAEDWVPDMESHVIVAACREDECAKEEKPKQKDGAWRGVFTTALVKVLKLGKLREEATYMDLIETLGRRVLCQTPNVTGGRENTRLWYQH